MKSKMKISGFPILLAVAGLVSVLSLRVRDPNSSEQIKPYTNNHLAVQPQSLRLLSVPNLTSSLWSSYETNLLSSASSRYVGSTTIQSSADYIESELRKLGIEVFMDEFPSPVVGEIKVSKNIVGRLVGSVSESILVGAHYDSLPSQGVAPGADDNGSGVASLLSMAHALSETKLRRNIIFVAFSGEEAGMLGSAHFAAAVAPGMNIVSAIILDQVGNPGTERGVIFESVGDSPDRLRIIDTLAACVDSGISSFVVNHNGFGSDHLSLSEAGIPSVLVIESENMKFAREYGHTARDVIANIDPSFGSAIARTVLGAVVRLAMA